MTLGQRIKELRTEAGLSQRALASALGTTQNQVYLWESDKFQPSLKYIHLLAKELNCTMSGLLL